MNETYFKETIRGLYEYFRIKESPLRATIDEWYLDVKWIPGHAVPKIVKEIRKNESLPFNIPHRFITIYKNLPKKKKEDDITTLWKALDVLKDQGEEAFKRYCESVKMSADDRAAVMQKFKCAYTYADVKNVANSISEDSDERRENLHL